MEPHSAAAWLAEAANAAPGKGRGICSGSY